MLNIDKNFNEIIEVLFDTQNEKFDHKFEEEKLERFKELCKTKKFIFFGTGYYLKSIVKYFKLNFGVDVYGAYDWVEEEIKTEKEHIKIYVCPSCGRLRRVIYKRR